MLGEILGGAALFATILGIFFSYNGKKTRQVLERINDSTQKLIKETQNLIEETRNLIKEEFRLTREILDRMDRKLDAIYDEVSREPSTD